MTEAERGRARPHLLLVDDEPTNVGLLKELLEDDYRVTTATKGAEALAQLDAERYDLVLLDILLPDISGLDILKSVRANPDTADLPIILMSALGDSEDVVKGLEWGANDYLTKPLTMSIVRARVNTQLRLKAYADEHKQMIDELINSQQLRSRLFSIASHDLKNPISNIRMAEYLLRERLATAGDSEYLQLLDTISMALDNMQDVIEELLELNAIQSGKMTIQFGHVNLEQAIWAVLANFMMLAENKHIQIRVQETEGAVWADQERLQQILANLISNAIKYTPPHSQVTIWTETRGDYMRLCVADQGPGIPPQERPLLFREFTRLTPRPTGGESSTGLGLWIVKYLADLQGGRVGADFPHEGGSIFWAELPMYQQESLQHPS